MSIIFVMIVALVFLGFISSIIPHVVRGFRVEAAGPSARLRSVLLLAILIGLPVYCLIRIQSTPPAKSIKDDPKVTDATQQLSILSPVCEREKDQGEEATFVAVESA